MLDTAWSPFDDYLVASAGEDGRVAITRVDESILRAAWAGDTAEVKDLEPIHKFNAHGRKAGHVLWHPTANGILASASTEVKIWDVEAGSVVSTGETHSDMVQSLSWDYTGTTYATYVLSVCPLSLKRGGKEAMLMILVALNANRTCKDKKLRLFDPRAGPNAVTVAESHSGIKGSRVAWMGSLDRIITTGFSRSSESVAFLHLPLD